MTLTTVYHALLGAGFSNGAAGRHRGGVIDTLREWQNRARSRAALKSLDDRMLKDMGLTIVDVDRETSKPFWTA